MHGSMTAHEVLDAVTGALEEENVHQLVAAIRARHDHLAPKDPATGQRVTYTFGHDDRVDALAEQAAAAASGFFDTAREPWHEWTRAA